MAQLSRRYLEYRRIGFTRTDAFRFAWLVAMAGARPVGVRQLGR